MRNSFGPEAFSPRGYKKIEILAERLPRQLHMDRRLLDAMPGAKFFENQIEDHFRFGGMSVRFSVGTPQAGAEGETLVRVGENGEPEIEVIFSNETYEGFCTDQPRARFCAYHELGHVLMHNRELSRWRTLHENSSSLYRARQTDTAYMGTDWQANAFSAAILMPAGGLKVLEDRGMLTPERVAAVYLTSEEAAKYRIDNFNRYRSDMLEPWRERLAQENR